MSRAALAAALALGCALPAAASDDWYPADISPPPGTRYPCALEALPRELSGVPEGDRRFVNHVYTLVLRATQAKLVLMRDVEAGDAHAAFSAYATRIAALLEKLGAEPAPKGLERFRADVVAAIELQRDAFAAAVRAAPARAHQEVFERPEARSASRVLIRGWQAMSARYPQATPEVRDSLFHHLCALDLF